jgi:hypothetical protein
VNQPEIVQDLGDIEMVAAHGSFSIFQNTLEKRYGLTVVAGRV